MIVKYISYFFLRIFHGHWSMESIFKNPINSVKGIRSHFLYLVPYFFTTRYFSLVFSGTFYLDHRTIQSDGWLLFFSIIVKILFILCSISFALQLFLKIKYHESKVDLKWFNIHIALLETQYCRDEMLLLPALSKRSSTVATRFLYP